MDDLAKLFEAYRASVPDPDPSPGFTPGVWRRIEAQRSSVTVLRRFAQAFAVTAAAFVLLIGAVVIPRIQRASAFNSASYVDVLANDSSADMAYADAPQHPGQPAYDAGAPPVR
jgi:hypothetical protein